jgi:hypothetical protein
MQALRFVLAGLLLAVSSAALAHPSGLPHHFFTSSAGEHSWLLGGWGIFAIGLAVVFILRWVPALFWIIRCMIKSRCFNPRP